jgi:hypothetical protein
MGDPAWQTAEWTAPFVDILGPQASEPRFKTRAKMLWSPEFLYVGAWLEEPNVWATITEQQSVIFQDNDFEVFIDPDGDGEKYFEFEINALNTKWDLFLPVRYSKGGSPDGKWRSNALSAVSVHGTLNNPNDQDEGWSVEIAFPWSSFVEGGSRIPPETGDAWRLNFSRVEWQTEVVSGTTRKLPNTPEDNWVWSPQGVIDMHQPEQWGFVHFQR